MSSMRSASSITSSSTPVSRSLPRSKWSRRRPGRGDQHVRAAHELGILIGEGDAADDQRDVELVVGAVAIEILDHLGGQLARRLEDQRARHPGAGAAILQERQHRQRERRGLAGAGLGDAEDVAARQHMGDGLGLDRRRLGVTRRFDGVQDFLAQSQVGKRHLRSGTVARPAGAMDTVAATAGEGSRGTIVRSRGRGAHGSCQLGAWRDLSISQCPAARHAHRRSAPEPRSGPERVGRGDPAGVQRGRSGSAAIAPVVSGSAGDRRASGRADGALVRPAQPRELVGDDHAPGSRRTPPCAAPRRGARRPVGADPVTGSCSGQGVRRWPSGGRRLPKGVCAPVVSGCAWRRLRPGDRPALDAGPSGNRVNRRLTTAPTARPTVVPE